MVRIANSTCDPTTEKPPRPRRWIPLSLRMFVAILVLLGVGNALWIGVPAYRQHVSIREIERVGGKVVTRARGPKWLRGWVGDERMKLFDEVVTVLLKGSEATDDTLTHLTGLTSLQSLRLANTRVTDTGLMCLNGLSSLNDLELANTQVTDAGLAHLKRLTSLQRLNLSKTHVTDAGLVHLSRLTNLQGLSIKNTQVTRAGVAELKCSLPELSTDSSGGASRSNGIPSSAAESREIVGNTSRVRERVDPQSLCRPARDSVHSAFREI